MYPTTVYGYAFLPYFNPNCPQCLQERQAQAFNNRATSALNPLAKEFVPGQAFKATVGASNHHHHDDDDDRDEVRFVSNMDAFPALPSVQVGKTEQQTGHNEPCQATSWPPDKTSKKNTSVGNQPGDEAEIPLPAPVERAPAESKIRKVSTVTPASTEKDPVQTTAPTTKTVPDEVVVQTRPPTPATTDKDSEKTTTAKSTPHKKEDILVAASPAISKTVPENGVIVKTTVVCEVPTKDIPPTSEKIPEQTVPPETASLGTTNANNPSAPAASPKNATASTTQVSTVKPLTAEQAKPEALSLPENNTEKKVTLASIVARTIATSAAVKNTGQRIAKAPRTAVKTQEPECVQRRDMDEAFGYLKESPAEAEARFRALLEVRGNSQWVVDSLKEGLARSLLRQGRPHWAEAEGILNALQEKFTDSTQVKHMMAVNLTLAHVLINSGKYLQSRPLLLRTMEWADPERVNLDEQVALITPCGHQRLDQAMVRVHLGRGHYDKARRLLLGIMASLRPPEQLDLPEEEIMRTLCGNNELDVLMCRILEKQQRFAEAETMLLVLMCKYPIKRQKRLTANPVSPLPCADEMLNLNLSRLLSESGKDHQARLFILQAMARAEPARHQLIEDQDLWTTPCSDHKWNMALVRQLHKEGNRTAAIHLLTAVMQTSGKNGSTAVGGIAPCDDSNLNSTMLRLLSDEHRLAEAEAFLLQVMDSHRPKDQRNLPRPRAITTPCGCDSWDLAMVQLQGSQKNLPAAEALMCRIVAQQRPERERGLSPSVALVTPCGNQKLDLQMAKVLCQRAKYTEAESLLLALMRTHRPQSQSSLLREEALVTACGNNEVDMAMASVHEEQGNVEAAITLMLSSMATYRTRRWELGQLSREQAMQTPCLRHEHNMALLRLLSRAGKKEIARQLLQEIMVRNCLNEGNQALGEGLFTPCGHNDVDRTAVAILLEMNEQEKSINLLLAMMKLHRPNNQQNLSRKKALTTPCQQRALNQMLFAVLSRRVQTHGVARQLMLAMMKSCPLHLRITIPVDQLRFTPCNDATMNMSMIMLYIRQGDTSAAKKLLLATMDLYRRSEQQGLPEQQAQITPCRQHDLDLTMVRLLTTENRYQEAKTLLLAMMKIGPEEPVTTTVHGPCGSPVLDMAMLRLLETAGLEKQHSELLSACLECYPEDADFLALSLIDLCRQCKWAEFDQRVAGLRRKAQHDLTVSVRYFNEALHCYLGQGRAKGKALCTKAYEIADGALQKFPQNSLLLSHKAHCARILGHPPQDYLPLFERARVLNPDGEQTEKDDHWRNHENKVIKLLGV